MKAGSDLNTVAIIQSRMGSTRLPGKVMKLLCGRTVLSHVIGRVKASRQLDEVIVATTTDPADDVIVKESVKNGARVFRGSEHDVLARYYLAAKEVRADVVVRVTSDCPLFDPHVLSRMLTQFRTYNALDHTVDYLSNSLERTLPRGLDAEVFTFAALEKSYLEAQKDYEREHVTPYIYQHPKLFALRHFDNKEILSHYRWTLDTKEDFQLISEIYDRLGKGGKVFSTQAVLELFNEDPELIKINAHVHQKQLGE